MDRDNASNQPAVAGRLVLLGASNLTRGIATVLRIGRGLCPAPTDVLIASGHGRSYGVRSTVLGRTLPGITQCGLWPALADAPPAPTWALVTDVGNDLLYGIAPVQIAAWVETCLDRLATAHARAVLTSLPIANLARLAPVRFTLFRSVFFPFSRLTLPVVADRARELDERLQALAAARGLPIVAPRPEWYGLDPIHIKLRHWPAAWEEILRPLRSEPVGAGMSGGASLREWLRLRLALPDRRWLLGIAQQRRQPAWRMADGTAISLY